MQDKTLRIGVIDDDPEDVTLLKHSLDKIQGLEFTFQYLGATEGRPEPNQWQDIDLLFLDYLLGDHTGSDILQQMRESGSDNPVIVITGQVDNGIAARLLDQGANAYLDKLEATPEVLEACISQAFPSEEKHESNVEVQGL